MPSKRRHHAVKAVKQALFQRLLSSVIVAADSNYGRVPAVLSHHES
jgi:hypothetical protein